MALQQLTDEQTATWTREQKDQWWFANIYRGDMPQLTMRSALTGFLLGGVLAATALYIGGKTGIGIGVGLTSVILAFAHVSHAWPTVRGWRRTSPSSRTTAPSRSPPRRAMWSHRCTRAWAPTCLSPAM
jgi:hypothetical protein